MSSCPTGTPTSSDPAILDLARQLDILRNLLDSNSVSGGGTAIELVGDEVWTTAYFNDKKVHLDHIGPGDHFTDLGTVDFDAISSAVVSEDGLTLTLKTKTFYFDQRGHKVESNSNESTEVIFTIPDGFTFDSFTGDEWINIDTGTPGTVAFTHQLPNSHASGDFDFSALSNIVLGNNDFGDTNAYTVFGRVFYCDDRGHKNSNNADEADIYTFYTPVPGNLWISVNEGRIFHKPPQTVSGYASYVGAIEETSDSYAVSFGIISFDDAGHVVNAGHGSPSLFIPKFSEDITLPDIVGDNWIIADYNSGANTWYLTHDTPDGSGDFDFVAVSSASVTSGTLTIKGRTFYGDNRGHLAGWSAETTLVSASLISGLTGDSWISVSGENITHIGPSTQSTATTYLRNITSDNTNYYFNFYNLRFDTTGHALSTFVVGSTVTIPKSSGTAITLVGDAWVTPTYNSGTSTWNLVHNAPTSGTGVFNFTALSSASVAAGVLTIKSRVFYGDAKGHLSGSAVETTALTQNLAITLTGDTWIGVTGSAITHKTPGATAASINTCLGISNNLGASTYDITNGTIQYDARGHVIGKTVTETFSIPYSGSTVTLPSFVGDAWINLSFISNTYTFVHADPQGHNVNNNFDFIGVTTVTAALGTLTVKKTEFWTDEAGHSTGTDSGEVTTGTSSILQSSGDTWVVNTAGVVTHAAPQTYDPTKSVGVVSDVTLSGSTLTISANIAKFDAKGHSRGEYVGATTLRTITLPTSTGVPTLPGSDGKTYVLTCKNGVMTWVVSGVC